MSRKMGRFLAAAGRCAVMIGVLGLVVLAPRFMQDSGGVRPTGSWAQGEGDRSLVGAELMDFWASDGFADLARTVAAEPEMPAWEDVRALMEARGCTDLRYLARVRWHFKDGSIDELSYTRRPYEDPWHVEEFLQILSRAPESANLPKEGARRAVRLDPDDGRFVWDEAIQELFKPARRDVDLASSNVPDLRRGGDGRAGRD